MRKLILFSSALMFCQVGACCNDIVFVSQINDISDGAISELQEVGVNRESVKNFATIIQNSIKELKADLSYDRDGSIGDQIAVQSDLLSLVDMLLDFSESPDLQKAQKLREIAMSCCNMSEFELIKSVMDKMDNSYRFLPPIDTTDGVLAHDSLEKKQERLTKKKEDLHK